MTYSVAIRTLGLQPQTLKEVLAAIFSQTLPPEKVVIYIARGFTIPDFRVGSEIYREVPKGMVAQRSFETTDFDTPFILMLDDDVWLGPDVMQQALAIMYAGGIGLLGADLFRNHMMPLRDKCIAMLTNLVRPHRGASWGIRMHRSGSFSYIAHPVSGRCYSAQSIPGPFMLWRKDALHSICLKDEIWLDGLGFSYGDDALVSYKAYSRGHRVAIWYGSDVRNLDARTSSDTYRRDPERFYIRTKAMTATWWRMFYKPYGNNRPGSIKALVAGLSKALWLLPVMGATSLATHSARPFTSYLRGLRDGLRMARSAGFSSLPPYIG